MVTPSVLDWLPHLPHTCTPRLAPTAIPTPAHASTALASLYDTSPPSSISLPVHQLLPHLVPCSLKQDLWLLSSLTQSEYYVEQMLAA